MRRLYASSSISPVTCPRPSNIDSEADTVRMSDVDGQPVGADKIQTQGADIRWSLT